MNSVPPTRRGDRVRRFITHGWGTNAGKLMQSDGGVVDALILSCNKNEPWDDSISEKEIVQLIHSLFNDFLEIVDSKLRRVTHGA